MHRIVPRISLTTLLCAVFCYVAIGQTIPPQDVPLTPSATPRIDPNIPALTNSVTTPEPSNGAALTANVPDTTDDTADTTIDPASLLPDPTPVPRANASLIGGTIRNSIGCATDLRCGYLAAAKMTFAFDPRTHIYSVALRHQPPICTRGTVFLSTLSSMAALFSLKRFGFIPRLQQVRVKVR